MEFILPAGVVLTSFRPSFVPTLGFNPEIGVDDENQAEAREYSDDFFEGQTESLLGTRAPFSTRIKITGPADFTLNSVGIKTADTVTADRRTVVWESDHPVTFFNVVAGRLTVKRGAGAEVYYHPSHPYNVDEILGCLIAGAGTTPTGSIPTPGRSSGSASFPRWRPMPRAFPRTSPFPKASAF